MIRQMIQEITQKAEEKQIEELKNQYLYSIKDHKLNLLRGRLVVGKSNDF